MNATFWQAIGEALVCVIAGAGTMWSRRSSVKTDGGNEQVADVQRTLNRMEDTIGRIDTRLLRVERRTRNLEDDGR